MADRKHENAGNLFALKNPKGQARKYAYDAATAASYTYDNFQRKAQETRGRMLQGEN